jgi:hypothetical protein
MIGGGRSAKINDGNDRMMGDDRDGRIALPGDGLGIMNEPITA